MRELSQRCRCIAALLTLVLCQFRYSLGKTEYDVDTSLAALASGRYDYDMGVAYFSAPIDGGEDAEQFAVARRHLQRRATAAYQNEDMHEKWKSLYLMGNLLSHSENVRTNRNLLQ
jgi:hypothetical protein